MLQYYEALVMELTYLCCLIMIGQNYRMLLHHRVMQIYMPEEEVIAR